MLPGIGGRLLSLAYLDGLIPASGAEAAGRHWRALAEWRRTTCGLGPASSVRLIFEAAAVPLVELLGAHVSPANSTTERWAAATIGAPGARTALLVCGWGARLDPLWRVAVAESLARGARWAIVFNGTHVRVADAGRVYLRRHVEFDLDCAADDQRTCEALWTICTAAFAADAPAPLGGLVADSDRHAEQVCRSLRSGVLEAAREVLGTIVARASPRVPVESAFDQALTIVYRLLFLLFAEARSLVPVWHPVYRQSYTVESLQALAGRPGAAPGLWEAIRAIGRLAHNGCAAGELRVTPFNGRLFAPSRTPLAERRDLDEGSAGRAIAALATRPAGAHGGRDRIDYRDLGVEQLGAVYEGLLDYEPVAAPRTQARGPRTVALVPGSTRRKRSASFYTPQPLAAHLVRAALEPLTRHAGPDDILRLRIVDPAAGSGAFLVAACRFLAGAYEEALVAAGGCHPTDIGDAERASIRRIVAERCLYGVDLNATAVQLARLSLWLATLAADRPLTFLDHHLLAGDSLTGAPLARLGAAPRRARRRDGGLPLFEDDAMAPAVAAAWPVRLSLETLPDDTPEQVRRKEAALARLAGPESAIARWKRVANAWCAPWYATGGRVVPREAFADLADSILSGRSSLPAATAARLLDTVEAIAAARRFFHWELEFPEVFFGPDGRRRPDAGFDAVIGNPPWDMLRADLGDSGIRRAERRDVEASMRFARESGLYTAQGDGHVNRYQLFTERALALARPGGRVGLVLPAGLIGDHGSGPLRRHLFSRADVDAIVGFDNRRGIFPIHRSVRFVVATATAGSPTRRLRCRLGVQDLAALSEPDEGDRAGAPAITLTRDLLDRLSGPDLAIPWCTHATDLAIAERAAALFPPLGDARGWGARFGRELNATDDRDLFQASSSGVPVVDGRLIRPFRVDLASARRFAPEAALARRLKQAWPARARLAYRDVASATNRTTLIAAVLPARCISTHTVFCLRTPVPPLARHFLAGLFNSLVVNFLVRLRVSTHVTTAIVEGLPIPARGACSGGDRAIAGLARLLSRRFDPVGFADLNARVARLYQLSEEEYAHVVGSFPLVDEEVRRMCLDAYR